MVLLTRLFVISRVFFMVFLISGTALGETSSIETVTTANSVLPAAADDNVAQAIAQVQPYAVDVSGGVEQAKGIKDAARIEAFMRAVRQA